MNKKKDQSTRFGNVSLNIKIEKNQLQKIKGGAPDEDVIIIFP